VFRGKKNVGDISGPCVKLFGCTDSEKVDIASIYAVLKQVLDLEEEAVTVAGLLQLWLETRKGGASLVDSLASAMDTFLPFDGE
jgi:hypothetical protein